MDFLATRLPLNQNQKWAKFLPPQNLAKRQKKYDILCSKLEFFAQNIVIFIICKIVNQFCFRSPQLCLKLTVTFALNSVAHKKE
jgi:hypothetical protein